MVVVPKARGKVRICVDLAKLNDSVRLPYQQLNKLLHRSLVPRSSLSWMQIPAFGRFPKVLTWKDSAGTRPTINCSPTTTLGCQPHPKVRKLSCSQVSFLGQAGIQPANIKRALTESPCSTHTLKLSSQLMPSHMALEQSSCNGSQPVVYISGSMSSTDQRYAQAEKEAHLG